MGEIKSMINTRLSKLLGIRYPLLQGGMAHIAGGKLAGTVSESGGLGVIGSGGANSHWLEEQIHLARTITDKPVAVNVMMAADNVESIINIVIAEQIPIITTGGGNPGRYISRLKEAGIKVIPVISSVSLARRLVRLGADAVIAEGMESGGHIGEVSTMALVPMVVDAVDVPVIAAGGIFDGRGVVAALALGAEGVQVGTRFICSEECLVHPAYQERVLKARDRDTVVCGSSTAHPVRALHNQFTRLYLRKEYAGCSREELHHLGQGRYAQAALYGDVTGGTVLAGQISGAINKVESAAGIVASIMNHAEQIFQKWQEENNA